MHWLLQALKPPSKLKRKAVYFAKLAKAAVTAESLASLVRPAFLQMHTKTVTLLQLLPERPAQQRTQVAFGELGEAPLEALCTLSGAVALPLLCSPAMQAGRPELVARDVSDSLRKLADTGAPLAATLAGSTHRSRPYALPGPRCRS